MSNNDDEILDKKLEHLLDSLDNIENSSIIKLINASDWYSITDEIQKDIKKNGQVNDKLAQRKIKTAKMFSFVPGF